MNLIKDYDSNESEPEKVLKKVKVNTISINIAPSVDISHKEQEKNANKSEEMDKLYPAKEKSNHLTGQADLYYMNTFNFDEQYHNFKNLGFAYDPSDGPEQKIIINNQLSTISNEITQSNKHNFISKSVFGSRKKDNLEQRNSISKNRKKSGVAGSGNFLGPWAGYTNEDKYNTEVISVEQKEILDKIEEKRQKKIEEQKQTGNEFHFETIFHGKDSSNYQGRSYILPPSDLKPQEHTCYIPKKPIHTWSGHTKGVQVIRFFPRFGHFLLSGSLDTKIKLWDVNNDRKCVRTYMGHKEAVRDVYFANDGLHFLSASYDKLVHYWDSETGKVIKTFNIKKYPYCVRFNPDEDKQHSFLVASSNKKIGQYDVRSGNRTQQYDEHLGAVNTVTFIDNNRKFVSTSDDKKIFLWEYGIPVVVKHISEPDMHSITATDMNPSRKYFIGQSSENKIVVYDAKGGNFRLNRKKKFQGHLSAGYAIGCTFSPDGQFVVSGDSEGKVWFWDWKTTKNYRTIQAHNGVCIGVAWHPIDASRLATCGWDGTIRYWD